MTQKERVLQHLEHYHVITTWTAIQEYGITRLSGRILELREDGWDIETNMVSWTNRHGEEVRCAMYRLNGRRILA